MPVKSRSAKFVTPPYLFILIVQAAQVERSLQGRFSF